MCCGGIYFPTNLGLGISNLTPGDEIIILKGEGYPAVDKETVAIVWIVAGFSALCNDGTAISCLSNTDITTTGRHFEQFEISEAAKQMEVEAEARRIEQDKLFAEDEPDWSIPPAFGTGPE